MCFVRSPSGDPSCSATALPAAFAVCHLVAGALTSADIQLTWLAAACLRHAAGSRLLTSRPQPPPPPRSVLVLAEQHLHALALVHWGAPRQAGSRARQTEHTSWMLGKRSCCSATQVPALLPMHIFFRGQCSSYGQAEIAGCSSGLLCRAGHGHCAPPPYAVCTALLGTRRGMYTTG